MDNSNRNLFALMDQTVDALTYAIELEWRRVKLNFAESRVIFLLTQEKKMTVSEIAEHTFRRLHSVYALINKMEKKGLVEREKDQTDGKVYITLRHAALELCNKVNERAIDLAFSTLSDEEKKQLQTNIGKIRTEIHNMLGLNFRPPFLQ